MDPRHYILIVEDDFDIREALTQILEEEGYTVRSAANGREALDVAAKDPPPNLILLDLMMPVMNGFEVLQAMRDDPGSAGVPVIVLTAQILTSADMEHLQQGVTAVLGKEVFTSDEVLSQVEQALARSRRLGAEAQRIVRLAMGYMHEHYAEEITRGELAASLSINERYLTRCFRDETGLTPFAYLTRYRIKQARDLLDTTKLSITDIAQMTGFADSSHFSRTFQKEVGVAPRAYRHRASPEGA
jgi:YesN/AraC family two-component response regulator